MRKILLALLALPALAFGAAYDVGIDQRSPANNVWEKRLLASPTTTGILTYNPSTLLPVWVTLGQGLQVSSGVLSASAPSPTWGAITGKPAFSPVATSGDYEDLTGKPVIPAPQVPSDWSATSGPAAILNKPALFSGSYSDLTGIPAAFPPAAHNQAWSTITGTPTTLAGYGITDAASSQSLAGKYNTPNGTTAQYVRGDGSLAAFPAIPAAQVQSDWNATSGPAAILNKPAIPAAQVQSDWSASTGLGAILNKPTTFTPSAHTQPWSTITATPTTLAGYGITDAVNSAALTSALVNYATTASLSAGLAGKLNIPTGTTAQYIRGDGSLATLPTARRIETYNGTTNAQGQITVTYATPYPVVPSVQTPPVTAANQVWWISSSTTTGFTMTLAQRNVVTLLGLEVLLGAVVPVANTPATVLVVAQ